jgi:hypothetical protein
MQFFFKNIGVQNCMVINIALDFFFIMIAPNGLAKNDLVNFYNTSISKGPK